MRLFSPLLLAALCATPLLAATPTPVQLTLKNHVFSPARIVVAAGETISIHLVNNDAATEEFDSVDLKTEKLVTPGGQITFMIGPVRPGTYHFMGEFHPITAQGQVVAEAR